MKMTKILLLGCDGNAGINYAKSIWAADKTVEIIGTGFSKYHINAARDAGIEATLVDPNQWTKKEKRRFIFDAIDYGVEFIHAQPEEEVRDLCFLQYEEEIKRRSFGKNINEWTLFDDKWATMQSAGIVSYSFPEVKQHPRYFNYLLRKNNKVWIRARGGAGSKWALPVMTFQQAENWVSYLSISQGAKPTDFILSEYLPGKEFAVQLFYIDGELIHCQARERVEHHFAKQMVSGQSSTPSVARTVDNPHISFYAASCVLDAVKKPNGIYGVDMRLDSQDTPVMTEINYGRYFTTSNFFASIGVNTPYEEYLYVISGKMPEKRIDQVKDEMYWIRGLDHEPVLMETLPDEFG
jgi:hypothetical protein